MRIVIQRVLSGKVVVNEKTISEIGKGVVVLVGLKTSDTLVESNYMFVYRDRNSSTGVKRYLIRVYLKMRTVRPGPRVSKTLVAKYCLYLNSPSTAQQIKV